AGPISIRHDAICDLTLLVRGHLHYPASSKPVHIRIVPSAHAIACSCSRIAVGSKGYLLSRAKVRIKQEQEIEGCKEGVLSQGAARPHTEDSSHGSTLNSRYNVSFTEEGSHETVHEYPCHAKALVRRRTRFHFPPEPHLKAKTREEL